MYTRLRAAREYLGLTQEHAAEAAGLSVSALREVESGQRRVSKNELRCFSELYGVSEGDLAYGVRREAVPDGINPAELTPHDRAELQNLLYWKQKYRAALEANG